jgi:hypothetical protein
MAENLAVKLGGSWLNFWHQSLAAPGGRPGGKTWRKTWRENLAENLAVLGRKHALIFGTGVQQNNYLSPSKGGLFEASATCLRLVFLF